MPSSLPTLPGGDDALLVRTWFGDQAAWERLCAAAHIPIPDDGISAGSSLVDDPAYDGCSPQDVSAALPADANATYLFLADQIAQTNPDGPILVTPHEPPWWNDLPGEPEDRPEFRVVAAELSNVDDNLSIANMDWSDFTRDLPADGIHRGF